MFAAPAIKLSTAARELAIFKTYILSSLVIHYLPSEGDKPPTVTTVAGAYARFLESASKAVFGPRPLLGGRGRALARRGARRAPVLVVKVLEARDLLASDSVAGTADAYAVTSCVVPGAGGAPATQRTRTCAGTCHPRWSAPHNKFCFPLAGVVSARQLLDTEACCIVSLRDAAGDASTTRGGGDARATAEFELGREAVPLAALVQGVATGAGAPARQSGRSPPPRCRRAVRPGPSW